MLDCDERVLEGGTVDLVSVAVNYRRTTTVTNPNVLCFLSTIKKPSSKKKKKTKTTTVDAAAAELSDRELLQQLLRGRGLSGDRIKAIENVLTTPTEEGDGFEAAAGAAAGAPQNSEPVILEPKVCVPYLFIFYQPFFYETAAHR